MNHRIAVKVIFEQGSYVRYFQTRLEVNEFYNLVVKRGGFIALSFV